jgi:hypothetical protein
MNNYLIGLGAGVLGLILDAVLPIVFQEGEVEIFSFLFLLSFVFSVITSSYLLIFQKTDFTTLYNQLLKKSTDINILFYGGLRYLKYVLVTFGALNINPGLYSALYCFQIITFSIYSHIESNVFPNALEIFGYLSTILFLVSITYLYIEEKKGATAKRMLLYGAVAITIAMGADFIDSDFFSKLDKNPFEDIELSSFAMFIISACILFYRTVFVKGAAIFTNDLFDIGHLIYVIGIAIFICEYIPSLLEFTTFDWLNPGTIMGLFIIQAVLGFSLNYFYYNMTFSIILLLCIVGLIIGSICILVGHLMIKDKVDFSIFKHIRSIHTLDGVSTHKVLNAAKNTPTLTRTPSV